MPAQTRRSLRSQKRFKNQNKVKSEDNTGTRFKFVVLVLIGLTLTFCYQIYLKTKNWDPDSKLTVAVQEQNDKNSGVSIYILDIPREEITRIRIPGNTEVEVSNNLGIWKLSSVWELGKQEKKEGNLLARTVTYHFRFPVQTWAGPGFVELADGKLSGIFGATNSNFSLGDKIRIYLFSLKLKNVNKEIIDLASTGILKKTALRDGEEGYALSGFDSSRIYSKFSDYSFSDKIVRVQIVNSSGNIRIIENTGSILEVLGAKVSAITKSDEEDIFCEISGSSDLEGAIKKAGSILGCEEVEHKNTGNFDMVLKIGSKFK